MNDAKTETREKLKLFVDELKVHEFNTSNISIELAEFVASAIESYLNGETKSLNVAFGLTPKRGAPGNPKYREDCARKTLQMKKEGKSWKEINKEFPRDNEGNLRKYLREFVTKLTTEDLTSRLNKNDKQG